MSWGIEFRRRGATEFKQNSVRLALKEEAISYGRDLSTRMVIAEEHKVVEYPGEPANYYWRNNRLKELIREKRKPQPPPPPKPQEMSTSEQIEVLKQAFGKETNFLKKQQLSAAIQKLQRKLAEQVLGGPAR